MSDGQVIGVDIGTSSSKGVLVNLDGSIAATATREHEVSRPHQGWVEMDTGLWWEEFCSISRELVAAASAPILSVGASGMGPCVALTDHAGVPLRPAILYGVDTRATEQIRRLSDELGSEEILDRCGSILSTQSAGPKLAWVADSEPAVFERARRMFMPASWLAWNLTGEYVLDHHSASQCTPLYDSHAQDWYAPWANPIVGDIELPRLVWADTVVGRVTARAAESSGVPEGTPVVSGTIDAWAEAVSVDAQNPGDLMLMYGTTMFLINTIAERVTVPQLWGTIGALAGTRNLAGGMASSGAITSWLRALVGSPDYETLVAEAATSGAGANGLLMLPYFSGERTPIADPDARGVIAGLTLQHTRGDLYRAALEATAFGVRHNIDTITRAAGGIRRIVAVGGGTRGGLWPQIVSDVTGVVQQIPGVTIGASYGVAHLAAHHVADVDIARWNPVVTTIEPRSEFAERYDSLFALYLELYTSTKSLSHALAEWQRGPAVAP